MSKLTRKQVYNIIDGERDYQDVLPPTRTVGVEHTVGDYITILRHYLMKADEAYTTKAGDEAALDVIRKIAGTAIHCMEDHGAPRRGDVV